MRACGVELPPQKAVQGGENDTARRTWDHREKAEEGEDRELVEKVRVNCNVNLSLPKQGSRRHGVG